LKKSARICADTTRVFKNQENERLPANKNRTAFEYEIIVAMKMKLRDDGCGRNSGLDQETATSINSLRLTIGHPDQMKLVLP
jgi:hypothetical protein